jgi:hypothetical protein
MPSFQSPSSIAFTLHLGTPSSEHEMKHFLAAVSKVTVFGHTIKDIMALGDRCGAQGLLQANQLEGFIVCIRTFRSFAKPLSDFILFIQVMPVVPVSRKEIS